MLIWWDTYKLVQRRTVAAMRYTRWRYSPKLNREGRPNWSRHALRTGHRSAGRDAEALMESRDIPRNAVI